MSKGVNNAVVYSGTRKYTQRMAAVVKGVVDAGIKVPSNEETFPSEERINGEHLKVKNDIAVVKSKIDNGETTK